MALVEGLFQLFAAILKDGYEGELLVIDVILCYHNFLPNNSQFLRRKCLSAVITCGE